MQSNEELISKFRDSLRQMSDARDKVWAIVDFSVIYSDSMGDDLIPLLDEARELSAAMNYETGLKIAEYSGYFLHMITGRKDLVDMGDFAEGKLSIELSHAEPEERAILLNFISFMHWFKGEYEKAFAGLFEFLKGYEGRKSSHYGWLLYALGVFYSDTKDHQNAMKYLLEAEEIFRSNTHTYGIARSKNSQASAFIQQGRIEEATALLQEALHIYRDYSHKSGISRALNDLGVVAKLQNRSQDAKQYFAESIALRTYLNHVQGLATTLTERGETHLRDKDLEAAEEDFLAALQFAMQVKSRQKAMRLHHLLYETYKLNGNTNKALEHLEKYFTERSLIQSDEANNKIKHLQSKHEREQAEKIAELEKIRNRELTMAFEIIEQKNKDIEDSIFYAKRIQQSVLPHRDMLDAMLKEHFVLFRPKDIVSGDFYWLSEKQGKVYLAICDSTGHGVPGAFMSLLSMAYLSEAVNERSIASPAAVFDYVRDKLVANVSKAEQKDGFDGILLCIDFQKDEITYAAAFNRPVLVREGEWVELDADRMPVGKGERSASFTDFNLKVQRGDCLYLYTDGFADQFGGPRGKKYMYKRLNETLASISEDTTHRQKEILTKTFEDWKGELMQVDDVCVLGIRF
ncbi:MAG TPA: SpoIIE family protein phosphatase [Bacteroidia bacterium]|nr:SpoIIE family protein phosphatase [Bacteroidia bacterium]